MVRVKRLVLWTDLAWRPLSYDQRVSGLLRSLWDEPPPPDAPARRWWDWFLVGAVMAAVVLEAALRPALQGRWVWAATAVALAPTLLWRRTRPLLMVVIAFTICLLVPLLPHVSASGPNVLVFMLLLAYSVFRWGSGRAALLGALVIFSKIG